MSSGWCEDPLLPSVSWTSGMVKFLCSGCSSSGRCEVLVPTWITGGWCTYSSCFWFTIILHNPGGVFVQLRWQLSRESDALMLEKVVS